MQKQFPAGMKSHAGNESSLHLPQQGPTPSEGWPTRAARPGPFLLLQFNFKKINHTGHKELIGREARKIKLFVPR